MVRTVLLNGVFLRLYFRPKYPHNRIGNNNGEHPIIL